MDQSGVHPTFRITHAITAALICEFIKAMKIPIPPLEEQKTITTFADRATRKMDLLPDKVYLSIDRLREYRTALLPAAVTGKIDVREEVA